MVEDKPISQRSLRRHNNKDNGKRDSERKEDRKFERAVLGKYNLQVWSCVIAASPLLFILFYNCTNRNNKIGRCKLLKQVEKRVHAKFVSAKYICLMSIG